MMDWKGIPSADLTDYEVARIGYNNTVMGVAPSAEEVHNMACALQSSQARLSEAVRVLEEVKEALEIAGGFIAAVPESVTVAGDSAMYAIDTAYSQAKAFLATLGEENEA